MCAPGENLDTESCARFTINTSRFRLFPLKDILLTPSFSAAQRDACGDRSRFNLTIGRA
jgi:hypothetical protein